MLVGVLISIMISIVVGVNLVPTILTSINTAKAQATAIGGFAGLAGLMEVLAYVYIAVILLGAVAWIVIGSAIQQCMVVIPLIRGSLNRLWQGNPELARNVNSWASVETLHGTSLVG